MEASFGAFTGRYTNGNVVGDLAKLAEKSGFESVWASEYKLYGDVYVALALSALRTKSVKLGTAISCPFVRHPASIASAIATIHELSNGRAILGLGPGGMIAYTLAIDRANVVSSMREAMLIIRNLLRGDGQTFNGQHFRLRQPQLDVRVKGKIPVYLAATGEKFLKLGGECADGVIINVGIHQDSLKYAMSKIEEGARAVDRSLKDIKLLCWIHGCYICKDSAKAKQKLKPRAAMVLAHAPPWLRTKLGLTVEQQEKIFEAYHQQRSEDVCNLITDEVLDRFSLAGDISEVIEKVAEILKTGIQTILVYPKEEEQVWRREADVIRTFGRHVIPRFVSR